MFYYTTVFLQQTGSQKHETNSQPEEETLSPFSSCWPIPTFFPTSENRKAVVNCIRRMFILEAEINSRNRAGSSFLRRLGFEITSPGNPVVFRKDLSPGKAFLGMRRT